MTPTIGNPTAQEKPRTQVATFAELWGWAEARLPLVITPSEDPSVVRRVASRRDLLLAARWALDHPQGTHGLVARGSDGKEAAISKADYASVADVVPTASPTMPRIAWVAAAPSLVDVARGEPLCGADGLIFKQHYLAPLGLTRADVMVTHVVPAVADGALWRGWLDEELQRYRPALTIALGRLAKEALQNRADFVLPHPKAVRQFGDRGEVARKVRQIQEQLGRIDKAAWRDVRIAKAEAAKHIVFGVVLDPYQVDSQGDWCPPEDIENAAHDFVAKGGFIGLQHEGSAKATMVESWLWPYPTSEDYEAAKRNEAHRAYEVPYGNQLVHSGAWLMGTRIDDDALWAQVESGELAAYSIGGYGVRTDIDTERDMPQVEFIKVG